MFFFVVFCYKPNAIFNVKAATADAAAIITMLTTILRH